MPRMTVDGVGLEYLLEGTGGEAVVLLNGIAMTIAHWKPVAAALSAAGYKVLSHDMRGQMLSEWPAGEYSLSLHARDLASMMRGLGIAKAHIVGTSYGAEVAMTFAIEHPQMCASVVSIDGVSEYDEVLGSAVESWKSAALSDARVFYRSLMPWNYSASFLKANAEILAKREDAIAAMPRAWFEAFARLCDSFMAIDLTKDLGKIRCPALALVAEEDILKGPKYSRIIADGISGAEYGVIPGAGHAVVIERPDAVAARLLEFLRAAGTKDR